MQITVRRYQADEARSRNDFVLNGDDAMRVGGNLENTLSTAQEERGRGLWSDADREVWLGATLVGHLGQGGDVAHFARRIMEVCWPDKTAFPRAAWPQRPSREGPRPRGRRPGPEERRARATGRVR
jgi:hypothetical protein